MWSLLAYLSIRWAVSNIREVFARFEFEAGDIDLNVRISNPILAFLKKDLRLISRSPAYCFLVLLPIMEGLLLSYDGSSRALLSVLAFLVIVTYSMYGLEREEIIRILPVKPRTVMIAKTMLVIVIYTISIAVIDLVFVLRGKIPDISLEISMIPSVFAMSVTVLSIAERIGVGRDIYSGLSSFLFLMIPGLLVIYLPIAIASIFKIIYGEFLTAVIAISIIEFLVALILLNVI